MMEVAMVYDWTGDEAERMRERRMAFIATGLVVATMFVVVGVLRSAPAQEGPSLFAAERTSLNEIVRPLSLHQVELRYLIRE